MITPEKKGVLQVKWINDENLRHVFFDVYYTIEPCFDGDGTITPACGGGLEITQVHPRWLMLFDNSTTDEAAFLSIGDGTGSPIPTDAEEHLVACFEKSEEYKTLDDACREHAESE